MEPVEPLDDDRDATLSGVPGEDDRKVALRLYEETPLSVEKIAEFVGVSRQTVHTWVKVAGVGPRGSHSGPRLGDDTRDDIPSHEPDANLRLRVVLDAIAIVREDLASGQETLRALSARVAALEALSARLAGVVEGALGVGIDRK